MPRQAAAAAGFSTNGSTRTLMQPPPHLDAVEKAAFLDIVLNAPASHFIPSDAPLVACYAKAIVQERLAADKLRADGYVSDGKASAWLAIWKESQRAVTTLARMLSLNPAGKGTDAGRGEGAGPAEYYARMSLMEARHGEREPDGSVDH